MAVLRQFIWGWLLVIVVQNIQRCCSEECDVNRTALEDEIRKEMRSEQRKIKEKQDELLEREQDRLETFRVVQGRLSTRLLAIEQKTEMALATVLDPDRNATLFLSDLEEVKNLVDSLGENIAAILPEPRSCADVQLKRKQHGFSIERNGVYGIYSKGKLHWAYCDFNTDGGNWTVIQKRQDNLTSFFRTWNEFRDGFGHPAWNYWLGNEKVHQIAAVGKHTLRIEMRDFKDTFYFIEYSGFKLAGEEDRYRLSTGIVAGGNVTDSLRNLHDGKAFGAKDKFTNYGACLNCPSYCHGGWWYECCYYSNLNGRLENSTHNVHELTRWYDFHTRKYIVLKETEMKIRQEF